MAFWYILLFSSVFGKKVFRNLFFSVFSKFLIHFLIPCAPNCIINMESLNEKKSNTLSISLQKCLQEAITKYWLKSANILIIVLFVSNFSAPNTVRSSRNWSILVHLMSNFINLDETIKIYVFENVYFCLFSFRCSLCQGEGAWFFYCLECKGGL